MTSLTGQVVWWRKETFSIRWPWINHTSCPDYDEAEGSERAEEKWIKVNNLQTLPQTPLYNESRRITASITFAWNHELSKVQGVKNSRFLLSELCTLYRSVLRTKIVVADEHWSCIDDQLPTKCQFYVSLQVVHDNINTLSDIIHYRGHCIISFMAFYVSFQYSRVLYHDYDCRGAEMLSASHYGRTKWINIPEEAESGVQCACVWAQGDWRAQMLKASCGVSISPSCAHLFLIAACTSADFWSEHHFGSETILYIHSIPACDYFFSPSRVGYKLHNTIFLLQHSRQAGQQARWSQPLARSHLSADLQAVCDRELRCFFRMRSA